MTTAAATIDLALDAERFDAAMAEGLRAIADSIAPQ